MKFIKGDILYCVQDKSGGRTPIRVKLDGEYVEFTVGMGIHVTSDRMATVFNDPDVNERFNMRGFKEVDPS